MALFHERYPDLETVEHHLRGRCCAIDMMLHLLAIDQGAMLVQIVSIAAGNEWWAQQDSNLRPAD